jgi:hypothetical protein
MLDNMSIGNETAHHGFSLKNIRFQGRHRSGAVQGMGYEGDAVEVGRNSQEGKARRLVIT